MFALLIAGGMVYLLLGDRMEAILLLIFASLSVLITIVQESRSEEAARMGMPEPDLRALVFPDLPIADVRFREANKGARAPEGPAVACRDVRRYWSSYFSSATCTVSEPSTVRILARSASD